MTFIRVIPKMIKSELGDNFVIVDIFLTFVSTAYS